MEHARLCLSPDQVLAADRIAAALARPMPASSDFDLNPDAAPARPRLLRPAGVLVAVLPGPAGPDLVLTRRSAGMRTHAGQVALPGGAQDPEDPTIQAAALREAEEEIGLDPARVRVLGTLPVHETVTGYRVTPVVGLVLGGFEPRPCPREVDEVFRVPLSFVLDPANLQLHDRPWQGRRRRYYAIPYGPHYIWGATARILKGLADRLRAP